MADPFSLDDAYAQPPGQPQQPQAPKGGFTLEDAYGPQAAPPSNASMLEEFGKGTARSFLGDVKLPILKGANYLIGKAEDEIGQIPGMKSADERAQSLKDYEAQVQKDYAPAVPSATDIGSAGDVAHYAAGKAGEAAAFVPAMFLGPVGAAATLGGIGALHGATSEAERPGSTGASTATAAGLEGLLNMVPAHLLTGTAGQTFKATLAKNIVGMLGFNAASVEAQKVTEAVASGDTSNLVPTLKEGIDAAASAIVQGGVFGTMVHTLGGTPKLAAREVRDIQDVAQPGAPKRTEPETVVTADEAFPQVQEPPKDRAATEGALRYARAQLRDLEAIRQGPHYDPSLPQYQFVDPNIKSLREGIARYESELAVQPAPLPAEGAPVPPLGEAAAERSPSTPPQPPPVLDDRISDLFGLKAEPVDEERAAIQATEAEADKRARDIEAREKNTDETAASMGLDKKRPAETVDQYEARIADEVVRAVNADADRDAVGAPALRTREGTWDEKLPYKGGDDVGTQHPENVMDHFKMWAQNVRSRSDLLGTAARWVSSQTTQTGHEYALVTNHGEPVAAATSHERMWVAIPAHVWDQMQDPNSAIVYQHSHPVIGAKSTPLSDADIATLALPGMQVMMAHGVDGHFSAATATPALRSWAQSMQAMRLRPEAIVNTFMRVANSAWDVAQKYLNAKIHEGTITREQADNAWGEIANRPLSLLGYINYMSSHTAASLPLPIRQEALTRATRAIDMEGRKYGLAPTREVTQAIWADALADRSSFTVRPDEGLARVLGPTAEAPVEPPSPGRAEAGAAGPPGPQAPSGARALASRGSIIQRSLDSLSDIVKEPTLEGAPKLGGIARLFGTPFYIASKFREFGEYVAARVQMVRERERLNREFVKLVKPYLDMGQGDKTQIKKYLEVADAQGINPKDTNFSAVVNQVGGADQLRDNGHLGLSLSKLGERVELTPKQIEAAKGIRDGLDLAIEQHRQNAIADAGVHTGDMKINTAKDAATIAKMYGQGDGTWLPRGLQLIEKPVSLWERDKNGRLQRVQQMGYVVGDAQGHELGLRRATQQDALRLWRDHQVQGLTQLTRVLGQIEAMRKTGYLPHSWYGNFAIKVRDIETGKLVHMETHDTSSMFGDRVGRATNQRDIWAAHERLKNIYEAQDENGQHKYPNYKVEDPVEIMRDAEAFRELGTNIGTIDAFASFLHADGQEYQQWRQIATDAAKRQGMARHFVTRKDVGGYSRDLDRVLMSYFMGTSGYLARRQFAPELEMAMKNVQLSQIKGLAKYARDYEEYNESGKGEADQLRALTYMWTIGGNPSSFFRDLFQLVNITYPVMSMYTHPGVVARELSRASFEAMKAFDPRTGVNYEKLAPDIRDQVKSLRDQGVNAKRITPEQMAIAQGRSPWLQKLSPTTAKVVKTIVNFYGHAQEINRVATEIATLRMAKDPAFLDNVRRINRDDQLFQAMFKDGMDPSKLAGYMSDMTHFDITRVNRAAAERGWLGALLLQFKSFHLNNFALLYRLASGAYGAEGQKAFAVSMGLYTALAGVMGLPFAQNVEDLIESATKQLFGRTTNLETNLRQYLDDVAIPPMFAEAILHGGLRSTLGVEMGERLGAGSKAFATSPQSFIDWNSLAPAYSVFVQQPIQAAKLVQQGRYVKAAAQVAPPPIKGALQAAAQREEGYRTVTSNALLRSQNEETVGETIKRGLGFQSTANARASELRRAQTDLILRSHEEGALARALVKNAVVSLAASTTPDERARNTDTLRTATIKANQQIQAWNRANPGATVAPISAATIQRLMREEMQGRQPGRRLQGAVQGLGALYGQ